MSVNLVAISKPSIHKTGPNFGSSWDIGFMTVLGVVILPVYKKKIIRVS